MGHGPAKLQNVVPGVAVTTLEVVGVAGGDVDVATPGRVIQGVGLVVGADDPMSHRWLGYVPMRPAVPGGTPVHVLEIANINRLAGSVGGVIAGGHEVDGIGPGLGVTWVSPVDHTGANGKTRNFVSLRKGYK